MGRLSVETSLRIQCSLGTQPRYEAPGDFWIKNWWFFVLNFTIQIEENQNISLDLGYLQSKNFEGGGEGKTVPLT